MLKRESQEIKLEEKSDGHKYSRREELGYLGEMEGMNIRMKSLRIWWLNENENQERAKKKGIKNENERIIEV